jgi:hypothetical protein
MEPSSDTPTKEAKEFGGWTPKEARTSDIRVTLKTPEVKIGPINLIFRRKLLGLL